jgi:hypothetical protein
MLRSLLMLPALWWGLMSAAQVNEIGLTGGLLYYIGDLNPSKHYPTDMKLGGGLLFRHNLTDRHAFRLQGLYGTLQAYDSNSDDPWLRTRNLHFRARLFEAAAIWEINFFKYRSREAGGRKWTPFVFGGLAYFRASPQAEYNDEWYDLQPLGTEGQGTTARPGTEIYSVDQASLPFGGGFKFNLGRIDVQLEWGARRTWTDHLDDVSGTYVDNDLLAFENGPLAAILGDRSGLNEIPGYTNADRARGDRNTRDWYHYTGLSITYVISRFSDCDAQYNWMKRRR